MLIHVVRPGETVYGIARNYGVDPRRLMADNGVPADGGALSALATSSIKTVLSP